MTGSKGSVWRCSLCEPKHFTYAHEKGLSDAEASMIAAWIRAGRRMVANDKPCT